MSLMVGAIIKSMDALKAFAEVATKEIKSIKTPEMVRDLYKNTIKEENLGSIKNIDSPIAKEIRIVPDSPEGYHRPYLRKEVTDEIYRNAPMKDGKYLDPNTGLPINGTPDIGHIPGHEHWRESRKAFDEKLTQAEFNARMNNPDFYQLEDPANNRSHKFEDHSEYC